MLSERSNESFLMQVAYSELKMSHRFIRFTLNKKFNELSFKEMNKIITEYVKKDNKIEFFRLQDDNEVLNLNNFGLNSLYKEIQNSMKILEMNKKINYSLCIIYDLNKNSSDFKSKK